MRKDPRVGGGVGGTCEVAKNQIQHSPIINIYECVYTKDGVDLRKNNSCSNTIDRSLVRVLNYPALAIDVKSNTSFNIKFERTVTNVGIGKSIYKASILPNPKIKITVVSETLTLKSLYEKQSFVLTVTGNELPTQTVISSFLWSNDIQNVRNPIIVNVSD
ncbi:hypothetical protein Lal_00027077 [Lupinus albus]|nr:hypothetical protein Lal_00027077 [Lupinus albus]